MEFLHLKSHRQRYPTSDEIATGVVAWGANLSVGCIAWNLITGCLIDMKRHQRLISEIEINLKRRLEAQKMGDFEAQTQIHRMLGGI